MMKILLLGATGSIGASTCNCIRRYPEKFQIAGMSANRNIDRLAALAREFGVSAVCVGEPYAGSPSSDFGQDVRVFRSTKGLEEIVNETDYDVLLNALVGAVGLRATVAALKRKKRVALANKESLVIGGEYIMRLIDDGFGEIVPVDSEHSAILQCLCGENSASIESLIITASGGPFRETPVYEIQNATPADALNHPTWSMGKKITIDSATCMNKGFEVIEAHHLFRIPYDKIRVIIHPQSIVHSMVEFHDGAVMAQMGMPDMELPIQLALSFPQRLPLAGKRLSLSETGALTFFEPDYRRFPCLKLCLTAAGAGGTGPAVVNAANEVAVQLFLDNRIRYGEIAEIISNALDSHPIDKIENLETIEHTDSAVRAGLMKRYA
jgi:1-deoxy-D-xylulose-5-phosphate reductoisomerase